MKKLLVFIASLVVALTVSAPAMAFPVGSFSVGQITAISGKTQVIGVAPMKARFGVTDAEARTDRDVIGVDIEAFCP